MFFYIFLFFLGNTHRHMQTFFFQPEKKRRKLTLINRFAFVNKPNVVCLDASLPSGTISFNLSKQFRKWARLKIEGGKKRSKNQKSV